MRQRIIFIFFVLLLAVNQLSAGPRLRALKNWIDSADIAGADTTYVRWPKEGFIGRLQYTLSRSHLFLDLPDAFDNDESSKFSVDSDFGSTISLGLSYRGWGLSYSHDLNISDDHNFSFSTYGQTYGIELDYRHTSSFVGEFEDPLLGEDGITMGDISQRVYQCFVYWVFNHKRFSLPAALLQTVVQRRSAGSWLASSSFYRSVLHTNIGETHRFSETEVSIGGGYAYNWVFGKERFLVHLSLMPSVAVWTHNKLNDTKLSRSLSVNGNSHLAFIYNFSRYVAGLSASFNTEWIDMKTNLSIVGNNWSSRVFIGVRF